LLGHISDQSAINALAIWRLENDPEKWVPVFGKDHLRRQAKAAWRFNLIAFHLSRTPFAEKILVAT
jgi:hypothetical protein